MAKKPTKLKKMNLNSVDFVRRGANPDAHIRLCKSADYEDVIEKQPFFKSLVDTLKKAIYGDEPTEPHMDIQKSADDFQYFTECLAKSYDSIMGDDSLSDSERLEMLAKSTNEFTDTMEDYLSSVSGQVEKSTHDALDSHVENLEKGGYETMGINLENVDKSLLTSEEAAQLDTLLAKACKTEKADDVPDDVQASEKKKVNPDDVPGEGETEGMTPDVKKALEAELQEVRNLKKSMELKEHEEVAKKYEILGKKPEELAKTLHDMKTAGESVYKSYVAALDEQLSIVEKSGMFAEVGRTGSNGASYVSVGKSEAEGKIEALASEIRKADPNMSYHESIAKAWEQNPDLIVAYDQAYRS